MKTVSMNKGKIIRHDNGEEDDKDDLEVDNDSTDVRDLFGSSSVSGLEKNIIASKSNASVALLLISGLAIDTVLCIKITQVSIT